MARRGRAAAAAVAVLVLVLGAGACSDSTPSGSPSGSAPQAVAFDGTYRATIRRTTDGVPHINGPNLQSVTFGQGYASGQDYACTLADQILKVQGRRAEVLGAGEGDANVSSDFAWRAIGIDARARKDFATATPEVRDLMTSFVAGWNTYLADTGPGNVKGWCASAGWLQPLTPEDLYAYARSITLLASSAQVARYVGSAQPPGAAATAPTTRPIVWPGSPAEPTVASNGWAIGAERSTDGHGMLLGNPHFPWEGELRFWEVQLTVDGGLSIYGAQLEGLPGVGIGFTDQFAWTHTVSAGNRLTAYTLSLVPGKPTTYRYDGGEKDMTSRLETIKVKGADGSTTERPRTLWFSDYGPILDFPGVGWTDAMTTTYRDANIDNDEFAEQYLAMDQARSFDEFKQAFETYQGQPLFNTMAVSRDGDAWYIDASATPNLSPAAIAKYDAAVEAGGITKVAADSGAILLDGSDSTYQWVDEPGARDPGLIPYARFPQSKRRDYLFNANDSFWLNHVGVPLEGDYSPLQGRQKTPRSPRTRENAVVLDDRSPSGPSGEDGTFTVDELKAAALQNHGYTSRALRSAVVDRCRATTSIAVPDLLGSDGSTVAAPAATVDLAPACAVLAGWDGVYDLDRAGAMVWRELMSRYDSSTFLDQGALWANPFDPADPVGTPSGLAPAPAGGPDPVLVNLGQAVRAIQLSGLPLDAKLGDVQQADRDGTLVPIHGGNAGDGTTNVVGYSGSFTSTEPVPKRGPTVAQRSGLTADGYRINNGTSFLLAVDLTADGPRAFTVLTYGNTGDRSSPWFTSQTKRFSAKDWKPALVTDAAIAADPELSTLEVHKS